MGSVRIGTQERKDIFEAEKRRAEAQPAPGEYIQDSSTLVQKHVTMGIRREEKLNANPGPGEYEQDASKRIQGQNMGSVRIGTAERKDIFEA